MERGVKIGADVPYCLMRGTALAEGIGEKLKSLPPMIKCPVLIAKPQISVSTKFVYENLRLDENTVHPDIDALIQDIKDKDLHEVCNHMGNVLETVTIPNYPIIDEIKNISTFFNQLDSLIALHQRKQNHLKLLKKSLLQQMFM